MSARKKQSKELCQTRMCVLSSIAVRSVPGSLLSSLVAGVLDTCLWMESQTSLQDLTVRGRGLGAQFHAVRSTISYHKSHFFFCPTVTEPDRFMANRVSREESLWFRSGSTSVIDGCVLMRTSSSAKKARKLKVVHAWHDEKDSCTAVQTGVWISQTYRYPMGWPINRPML